MITDINNNIIDTGGDEKFFLKKIKSHIDCTNLLKFSRSIRTINNCLLESSENGDNKNNLMYKRLSSQACTILNELRLNNQLCDAIIRVSDGTEFPIHRPVLSAASNYFRVLFTNGMKDTGNKVVFIGGIDSESMRSLIEWAYTQNVNIDSLNVERLLPAADQFQIIGLLSKCIEYLKNNMQYDNVIGIKRFADNYYCQSLSKAAFNFLMFNFLKVAKQSKEIFELSYSEFSELILADELNIKDEKDVFEICIKWIDFNPVERRKYILELINCLRLKFLPKKYFIEKIKNHHYVKDNEYFKPYLNQFLTFYNTLPSSEIFDLSDIKIRPRIPHELIISIGGWYNKTPTNIIETYDPRADIWQTFPIPDKTPRAYHGCITINQFIYVIGGYDGTQFFNNCKRIDILKKEWQEISPMYFKRCYVSVAYCNNLIYSMGGFDGNSRLFSAEKYNPLNNQWSQIEDMHFARSDASAAELGNKVYICGGFNGIEPMDTVEMYDPNINQWTIITSMLSKRSGLGLVNYNGFLYSIGGYNGETRLNTAEKYDSINKSWSLISEMYSPRSNFGIAVCDGYIIVMGGYNGRVTIKNVECYSDEQKEWLFREKMNLERSALSVSVLKDIEYVRPFSALENQATICHKINSNFLKSILGYYESS